MSETIPAKWTVKRDGSHWVADSHDGWKSWCPTWEQAVAVAVTESTRRRMAFWRRMQARGTHV